MGARPVSLSFLVPAYVASYFSTEEGGRARSLFRNLAAVGMKIQKATRVLVVDDFKSFREWILSRLKTHAQFEIVGEASTGQDAIQMAERLNPDLILLDLGLPDINGIEAGKQISRILPLAKILFLSGCAEGDTVEPALCLGTSGYRRADGSSAAEC